MAPPPPWHKRCETTSDLDCLLRRLHELQLAANSKGPRDLGTYAFRGVARDTWRLEPTIVHKCNKKHDEAGLQAERELVEQFRSQSWRFLRTIERKYLCSDGIVDPNPAETRLKWEEPSIWGAIAIARHYGVPTRLLDWTRSAYIAAYFAACSEPGHDGAVWWFDQGPFNRVLHSKWDAYEVPKRDNDDEQRAIERKAFDASATRWISKIHHYVPFRRMELQQAFFTAGGKLDMLHDEAIDALDPSNEIARGRLIVPAELKTRLLDTLEYMGIHAFAIEYPAADLIGYGIAKNGFPVQQTAAS